MSEIYERLLKISKAIDQSLAPMSFMLTRRMFSKSVLRKTIEDLEAAVKELKSLE